VYAHVWTEGAAYTFFMFLYTVDDIHMDTFLGFQEGDRTFIVDFNTLHSLPQRRMCIKNLGVLLDWLSFFFGRFQVICILYFTTSVAKRGVGESTV